MSVFARATTGLLLSLVASGCAPKTGYVVGIYSPEADHAEDALDRHVERFQAVVERDGGRVLVSGLDAVRELPNPATDSLDPMPRGRILVAKFDSRRAARRFSRGDDVVRLEAEAAAQGVLTSARLTAKKFRPLPSMPDAPMLCAHAPAPAPAFILLDGITMKRGPAAPLRVMRYMKRNLPRLEEAQVDLLGTLAVKHVDAGSFDFDMLFMTQWPSLEVFDTFHEDAGFIADAQRYRNPAMRRFGEAQGLLGACKPPR